MRTWFRILDATRLRRRFLADDHRAVDRWLTKRSDLRERLNQGVFDWQAPPLAVAKSRQMVDVLIRHGASLDVVSRWWAPGFGAHLVKPEIARYLESLGAELTIHAATRIGLTDVVVRMLDGDPGLATAPGGDGAHPLHFCGDLATAKLLLKHGAELDARDQDHDSTPIQWRLGDAADVVQLLLDRGATPDIFLAAALGDGQLADRLLDDDPQCVTYRIGHNDGPFPGIGFQGRGGTIYQWTLGFNLSPHEVAVKRGHEAMYDRLFERSPPLTKLLVACTTANRSAAEAIAAQHVDWVDQLSNEDAQLLAKFCWETNRDIRAVRLMLDLGFPLDVPEHNHGYSALHNAAFCGDAELVRLLLDRGHAVDLRDPENDSTAVGWAIYSCLKARRHPEGDFPVVVDELLKRGTPFDANSYPVGHRKIDAVLKRHLRP